MLRSLRDKALAINTTSFFTPTTSTSTFEPTQKKNKKNKTINNVFIDYDPNANNSSFVIKPIYDDKDTKVAFSAYAEKASFDGVYDGDDNDDQPKAVDETTQGGLGRHLGLFSTTFLMCVPASSLLSGL
jgi:hypothetical protein